MSEPVSIEELIGFFSLVDLVETGDTMRAAGLEVVADILETEVHFTSLIYIILQGFVRRVTRAELCCMASPMLYGNPSNFKQPYSNTSFKIQAQGLAS